MTDDLNDKNLLKNLLKAVKELTKVLKKTNLTKNLEDYDNLEKVGNKRIKIKHDNAVTSPMVGTVYLSPEPNAKNFVNMSKPPLFLNLLKIKLPITAKASITHRISAIGVFFLLFPFCCAG